MIYKLYFVICESYYRHKDMLNKNKKTQQMLRVLRAVENFALNLENVDFNPKINLENVDLIYNPLIIRVSQIQFKTP